MDQDRDAEAADPVVKSEPELSWREQQAREVKRMELVEEEMRAEERPRRRKHAEDLQRFPREAATTESRAEKQPAPRPPRRFKLADIRKMTHDEYVALHPTEREVIYLLFQMISEIHEALAEIRKEIEQVKTRGLNYVGIFQRALISTYKRGDVATYNGAAWVCLNGEKAGIPGDDSGAWQLLVKNH